MTRLYLKIELYIHIFIPFFCATISTTKIQVTRFNKQESWNTQPKTSKIFHFSPFCFLTHRACSTHPFTTSCHILQIVFLNGSVKDLHSITSFFSLQFRTKRAFHFNTNLSSGQNTTHILKKKVQWILILQSSVMFEDASSQSELIPARGVFPSSNICCGKSSPCNQWSWLDCRLLFYFRNPECLPQEGGHPVHTSTLT